MGTRKGGIFELYEIVPGILASATAIVLISQISKTNKAEPSCNST